MRTDSAITHLQSNPQSLAKVCDSMLFFFEVLARAHKQFHLGVLEVVYIHVAAQPVLCQQKESVKVLYLV